jgi:pimeloyl-ACP methyl ester carboxylesterase
MAKANYAILNALDSSYSFLVEELPQPFAAPTLFLLGCQDSKVGHRDVWQMIENYPRASLVILNRAGHCLQIEQSNLFKSLVHERLDRVEEYYGKNTGKVS